MLNHFQRDAITEAHVQILVRIRQCFGKGVASMVLVVWGAATCCAQATSDSKTPQQDWVQGLESKYPGLLNEFGRLFEKLQHDVQLPEPRGKSRLLTLLPESTMSYGAFPNYGNAANQALAVFR
jgi:hypothetical protein